MSTSTVLRGISSLGDNHLSKQLQTNLCAYFQWGLLQVGNFFNFTIPTSGVYGGDFSRLRPAYDPRYTDGQVWQGARQDWVWETGVSFNGTTPIDISGVYVDGDFYPVGTTGDYAFHINYPEGRIVFDSAISTSKVVTCEYSPRWITFTDSDVPWWREIQKNSFRVDDSQFANAGSGVYTILSQNRVQLPAVVVEVLPETSRTPFQLGNSVANTRQTALFHILAEADRSDIVKTIHDVITYQWDKRLVAYNTNTAPSPLTYQGDRADDVMMYPELVAETGAGGHRWKLMEVVDMRGYTNKAIPQVAGATVRGVFEVLIP